MKKYYLFLCAILFAVTACKDDPEPPVEEPGSPPGNYINAIHITENGIKFFATKNGLASFDGNKWTVYQNPGISGGSINDFGYSQGSSELWLGTNAGVTIAGLPISDVSETTTYTEENTRILFPDQTGLAGDSVFVVTIDDNFFHWLGTQNGLSVFNNNEWPAINRQNFYEPPFFVNNPITSMDYSNDTVYIGTLGGGVARMVTNSIDAVTAASPYVIPWSMVASENILAVFADGNIQWFGTDSGISKHTGTLAKQNWETFVEGDGLINNKVQCISKDSEGNMWFGTVGGLSKFDGAQWTNYTTSDGLASNNVLCIAVDIDGSLWFGTDNGISHFDASTWTTYRAEKTN